MKFEVRSKSKAAPRTVPTKSAPVPVASKHPAPAVNSAFLKAAKAHLNQTRKVRDAVAEKGAPGHQAQVKKLDRHIAMVTARIQSETKPKQ